MHVLVKQECTAEPVTFFDFRQDGGLEISLHPPDMLIESLISGELPLRSRHVFKPTHTILACIPPSDACSMLLDSLNWARRTRRLKDHLVLVPVTGAKALIVFFDRFV
jgi:hypothetical protein